MIRLFFVYLVLLFQGLVAEKVTLSYKLPMPKPVQVNKPRRSDLHQQGMTKITHTSGMYYYTQIRGKKTSGAEVQYYKGNFSEYDTTHSR
jgi:hypothetical protein